MKKTAFTKTPNVSETPELMQKFLPYVFPAVVFVIVAVLAFRWYSIRTQRDGKVTPFAETVTVENLSQDDANRILKGVGDLKTAELEGSGEVGGQVRYEIKDGKVRFSVMAEVPAPETNAYQVWIKEVGSEAKKLAFILTAGKGGYIGSASVSETTLPFEVVVTLNDQIVLTGRVSK
ncbi:MAG TPA: hypothetical protein DEP87_01285 [Candidatus Pacebacteria bacterium]|nr:hypothetical protein [Candidatus Paceibacterota bacterium]